MIAGRHRLEEELVSGDRAIERAVMDAASRVGTAYSRPETASRGTYPSRPPSDAN
ncbi:hypothetical protein [Natrinema sp. CBA1119]|uniref:hypothetical protein n=1 Tax=Natrinema sp. CBA1119 TaxID=1608465 RepID=UPI00159BEF0C|nr:hypothetical protein [Natrinema sp. CBA1119]